MYVDDILVTGSDKSEIKKLKNHLHDVFTIKDLGQLHYLLGIEVSYIQDSLVLTQHKFTKEILESSGIAMFKGAVTPLPLNMKLSSSDGDLIDNPILYRCLVGKLNFLTNTRPDLSYTVQSLSQFMQNPRTSHWKALTHTLNYVHTTCGQGIVLKGESKHVLQAFSDSDWAACIDSRRFVTGYILLLANSPISWKSKKQHTVSKSSSEVEYRAMSNAASEITWVVRLLQELNVENLQPVTLHSDNQSTIYIAKNPVFHDRTKHIEIDCHFTRDKVLEGLIQLSYLPTRHQLADILTKVLPSHRFKELLSKLGVSYGTS